MLVESMTLANCSVQSVSWRLGLHIPTSSEGEHAAPVLLICCLHRERLLAHGSL
jgi:hypothetical protein